MLAFVLLTRIPYVLTHDVQEDAYISARAVHNLVTHGALEFNVGDHYSPVTSLAWGYLAAIPAAVLPTDGLMLGFQAVGIASVALAILLLSRFLSSRWTVFALALCAPGLFASFLGMETGSCILYLAFSLVALQDVELRRRWLYLAAAAGPLIRPEFILVSAALVGLTLLTARLSARDKLFLCTAPVLGAVAYVTMNLAISGERISPTVLAKTLAYPHDHSLRAFAGHLWALASGQFILPGPRAIPASLHLVVNLAPLGLLSWRLTTRAIAWRENARFIGFVVFIAYGLPTVFALGGQFAQWYLFPCAFFAVFLGLWSLPPAWRTRTAVRAATLTAFTGVAVGLLALAYSGGTQEYGYRADVGRWLRRQAGPEDTLLLEPAGYIPFYSGLKTYDDVGLVSPVVLEYLRLYGRQWWWPFVQDRWPDWIIDRHDFRVTAQNDACELSPAQHRLLLARYELVKVFHYDPRNYARNAFGLRVLRLGAHADYYVYRLKQSSATPAASPTVAVRSSSAAATSPLQAPGAER